MHSNWLHLSFLTGKLSYFAPALSLVPGHFKCPINIFWKKLYPWDIAIPIHHIHPIYHSIMVRVLNRKFITGSFRRKWIHWKIIRSLTKLLERLEKQSWCKSGNNPRNVLQQWPDVDAAAATTAATNCWKPGARLWCDHCCPTNLATSATTFIGKWKFWAEPVSPCFSLL